MDSDGCFWELESGSEDEDIAKLLDQTDCESGSKDEDENTVNDILATDEEPDGLSNLLTSSDEGSVVQVSPSIASGLEQLLSEVATPEAKKMKK